MKITKNLLGTLLLLSLFTASCGKEEQKVVQSQALPVKLATLKKAILIDSTEYVGTLEAVKRVALAPKINGRIIGIFVQEGDFVKKGQKIAQLEPTQQKESVNAATANIQSQIAAFNQSEAELRQREAEKDSAKSDMARLKANVTSSEADFLKSEADLQSTIAYLQGTKAELQRAKSELQRTKSDLQRAKSDLDLAQTNYKRADFLFKSGVQPKQDLDDKTRDLDASKANAKSAEANVTSAEANVKSAEANIKSAEANVESSKKSKDAFAGKVEASKQAFNASISNLRAAEKRIEGSRASVDRAGANINESKGNKGAIEQELIYNSIIAPISGAVGDFNHKKLGDYLNTGETFTTITKNELLNLNINVPTEDLNRLRQGLPVEIISNDGGSQIRGEVTYISSNVDQNSQSVLTKVTFTNDGTLKDDQYVRVRLIWNQKPGILIPTAAISSLGGQKFVFVANKSESQDGKSNLIVKQQPIKVGSIQGQYYQIISGVQPGDQIAVSRILDLKDKTPITKEQ